MSGRVSGFHQVTVIKTAIEQATHVTWGNTNNRLVFISQNVTTGKGRPMAVVVERVSLETGVAGKVITASWKSNAPTDHVIWEAGVGFFASFDPEADIVYVSRGAATEAYAVEDTTDRTIWYRYADIDDSHLGVTVFAASRKSITRLAEIVSSFLNIATDSVQDRLTDVMQRM